MKGILISIVTVVGLGIITILIVCMCWFNWNSHFNGVVKFDISINRDTAEQDIARVLDNLQDLEPYAININGVNYGDGKVTPYADNVINTVTYEANVGFRTQKSIQEVREHFGIIYGDNRGVSIGREPIYTILVVLESIGIVVVLGAMIVSYVTINENY